MLLWLTSLGGTELMVGAGSLAVAVGVARSRRWAVLPFATLVLGGQAVLTLAVKAVVDRARARGMLPG